jgi:hypothetical protein
MARNLQRANENCSGGSRALVCQLFCAIGKRVHAFSQIAKLIDHLFAVFLDFKG